MPAKKCPACGFEFTMRRYLGLRSQAFACPGCGAPLAADTRRALLAIFLQAPLLAVTIRHAVRDPWYWLAMAPVIGVCFLIHYACFRVVAKEPVRLKRD